MRKKSSVSVVIPTRNRLASLNRLLHSIALQTVVPDEIIIVDSSENTLQKEQLNLVHPLHNIQIIHSKPSVCLQRNIGITQSISDYIFLCDDDIELSANYCEALCDFLETNPTANITSGLVLEKHCGTWHYAEPSITTVGLINAYVFGTSIGIDINQFHSNPGFFYRKIITYYQKKGNHIAKSGWPIIVHFDGDCFQTPIYGLGASIIRSEALKKAPFDEAFFAHGVGDNYDLAMGLDAKVNVITQAKAYHHRENSNRLQRNKAYFYRINALHYILKKHRRFNVLNLVYFCWSLCGKFLVFLVKGKLKLAYYTLNVIRRVLTNQLLYKIRN